METQLSMINAAPSRVGAIFAFLSKAQTELNLYPLPLMAEMILKRHRLVSFASSAA